MTKSKLTLFDKLKFEDDYKHKDEPSENIRSSIWVKSILILSALGICTFLFSFHPNKSAITNSEYNYTLGYRWNAKNITADFSFPVYKEYGNYLNEVKQSSENSLKVFELKKESKDIILSKLINYTKFNNGMKDSLYFSPSLISYIYKQNPENVSKIRIEIQNSIRNFVFNNYSNFISNVDVEKIRQDLVIVAEGNVNRSPIRSSSLIDSIELFKRAKIYFNQMHNDEISELSYEIFSKIYQPNLVFSKDLTNLELELNKKSVLKTVGMVRKGEIIIRKGERISKDHILKLQSYQNSKSLREKETNNLLQISSNLGHITLIFSFILVYLYNIRKKIFYDNIQISILCTLLVLVSLQAWLSVEIPSEYPMEFLIFLPAYSMLAAIVFDSRTSFNTTVTMIFLIAAIRGNDYTTALTMFFAGFVAAYTVRDIRSRTQMFKSIIIILVGYTIPIIIFGIERSTEWIVTFQKIGIASINAIISPIITFGLLFLLERFSDFASDLRLQEFNDLNHPLLSKMSEIAPGTYQHSIGVAILAEKCAQAIGANELYCKVSSYYHDIGKIERPEYFVENQIGYINKHDSLPPKKSASHIIEHVTGGAELARQYKLPQRLIDIIYMHHGTSLVQHFYAKALEQSPEGTVFEKDFRYPGPKPNSKEAAIVMICDTAEAISRIGIKSSEELEKTLEHIINDRILDGQFDECKISIQELQIIKLTIVKNLVGVGHQRMVYKEIPKDKISDISKE